MKKLEKPKMSVREILTDISNITRDKNKKSQICDSIDLIKEYSDKYDDLATNHNLHTFIPYDKVEVSLTSTDLQKLYTNSFSKGSLKEKYYSKILALSKDGKCPICGIGQVSNLDHYLAKTIYPIFSVTPINLIPICRDCNFKKRDKPIINYVDSPLHPYYDDIDNFIWLSANILKKEEGNIVVEYFVDKSIMEIDNSLYCKLNSHCNLYRLFELYAIQATTEVAENLDAWKRIAFKVGIEKLKDILKDMLISRENFQKNTWITALFRSIIDNINIIL